MGKRFVERQQEIIDDDIRSMSPEEINDFLSELGPQGADAFLEKVGHRRAADIYGSYEEHGCLEAISLRLCIVLSALAFCRWLLWPLFC